MNKQWRVNKLNEVGGWERAQKIFQAFFIWYPLFKAVYYYVRINYITLKIRGKNNNKLRFCKYSEILKKLLKEHFSNKTILRG